MNHPAVSNGKRLFKLGLISNILESYDFIIYAYLAPIMGSVFFDVSTSEVQRLIQVYVIFAVSYIARPLGSVFWGWIGDRTSRTRSMQGALFMMTISTVGIGCLPSYDVIGVWATLCLLVLRFAQMFSVGGEMPLSGCYIYENSQGRQRNILCSTVVASTMVGYCLASVVENGLFYFYTQETIIDWAWRLPYLLSILLAFWIGTLRRVLFKSEPESKDSPRSAAIASARFKSITVSLLPLMLISAFTQITSYIFGLWMPVYLTQFLHISPQISSTCKTVFLSSWFLFTCLTGYISSRFTYRNVIITHILITLLLIIPLFQILPMASFSALVIIHIIFAWASSGLTGTLIEMLGDAFSKENRALGMSLGATLPITIFGSTAPLICTYFTNKVDALFPVFYIILMGLLALPAALKLKPRPTSLALSS